MRSKSTAQLLLLSAIWGISFLLIRIAGQSFPPFWIALLRSSLGALLLWTVFFTQRLKFPPRSALRWLLLVALFNNALPFTCFAWGERIVPSNIAAVLNATTPIFTLLLITAMHRKGVAANVVIGVLIGFTGVICVVLGGANASSSSTPMHLFLLGVAIVTVGALGYAIATVIAKAKLQEIAPVTIASSQLALAALFVLPFAVCGPPPTNPGVHAWLAVGILGFAGSGVAYLLFFHILRTVPATQTVAVTYLLPIWGVIWGSVAHESVGILTYIGVAGVIAGLLVMNRQRKPSRLSEFEESRKHNRPGRGIAGPVRKHVASHCRQALPKVKGLM